MTDILKKICDRTAADLIAQKQQEPLNVLKEKITTLPATRGFQAALEAKEIAVIAEVKKASPSRGVIRESFDPVSIAKAYEAGGAACISVLTDAPFFQGELQYLQQIHAEVEIPLLRKDFMIDPYQVYQARAYGADCILLIMAALDDALAKDLEAVAMSLGLDVLIETHDEEEIERAKTHLQSTLIGVNNRNLSTLEISLENGKALSKMLPEQYHKVCESGIYTRAEIDEMKASGFHSFLIGESLMKQDDITAALKALI